MGHTRTIEKKRDNQTAWASRKARGTIEYILKKAGAELDGSNPWDPQLNNPDILNRLVSGGSIAIGESYMNGDWNCDRLDELVRRIHQSSNIESLSTKWRRVLCYLYANFLNRQSLKRSGQVADVHYNLDARFFEQVLGETMVYSCAYWKDADSLEQAQRNKLDLICKKLDLQAGDSVLDIGCGWGSLAHHAASNYGCRVVGISIANEQIEYAKKRLDHSNVEYIYCDYRQLPESLKTFDKIVSIGMFEHVGPRNYKNFMEIVASRLNSGGRFLLHSIVGNGSAKHEPWLTKYIFPNAVIAEPATILRSVTPSLVLEDIQNLRYDYSKTLIAWYQNLKAARKFDNVLKDERLYRMWRFYLLTCAGAFAAGTHAQLWQMLFSKDGVPYTIVAAR